MNKIITEWIMISDLPQFKTYSVNFFKISLQRDEKDNFQTNLQYFEHYIPE